jgi:hypothetical protein
VQSDDPGQLAKGVKDVAVYGQLVTKSLRHLRDVVPDFDEGWRFDSTGLRESSLAKYFKELRNEIEHGGRFPLAHVTMGTGGGVAFSTDNMPPGFTAMIGTNEGMFWVKQLPDGKEEWRKVQIDPSIAYQRHVFTDIKKASVPAQYKATAVATCCADYLQLVRAVYEKTLERWQPGATIVDRVFT